MKSLLGQWMLGLKNHPRWRRDQHQWGKIFWELFFQRQHTEAVSREGQGWQPNTIMCWSLSGVIGFEGMKGPWRKTDVRHLVVGSVSPRRGQETVGGGAACGAPTIWDMTTKGSSSRGIETAWAYETVCASDWQNQRNGSAHTLWHPEWFPDIH